MTLKHTALGLLIYAAMLLYGGAFGLYRLGRKRAARAVFVGGFAMALAALVLRWVQNGFISLQNLFELFLAMGVVIWPIAVFCRRLAGRIAESADPLLGFVLLWPAGFIFGAEPRPLPPALQSWLFIPHVLVYVAAYVFLARSATVALRILWPEAGTTSGEADAAAFRVAAAGFPLLTFGLLLGAWWGKIAWGDYWHWDPKEMWSLATWLLYAGYLHFRHTTRAAYPRINAALLLAGLAAILLTVSWVNLSRIFSGLHSYAR